jgi:type II secretory pathway pseudopilin PulG
MTLNRSTFRQLRTPHRRGFTLTELAISVVSTSVLMAGIVSSLMIASKAASTNNASNAAMMTSLAAAEMVSELATAKSFSERTATSVTFKVDDQDGNLTEETIRYSWSGQGGAPLLRTYNGTSATAAENVYSFALAYTVKPAPIKRKILFVRGNVNATRTGYDRTRRDLMHSWGFQVIPFIISASTTQSEIDAHLSVVDAVYISATADAAHVGTRFHAATEGVVIENGQLFDEFKLYTTNGNTYTDDDITIAINTHSVTSGLETDKIDIIDSNITLNYFDNTNGIAPGAVKLGKQSSSSKWSLIAIDKGAALTDATAAAGRRVSLPWGTIDFNPTLLINDGETLFENAVTWASYNEVAASVDVTLQVGSINQAKLQTQVEMISKPVL